MKTYLNRLILGGLLASSQLLSGQSDIELFLDQNREQYVEVANRIWQLAELGYLEYESSALLQEILREAGFTVTSPVAGIPTAFIAEYGSGKPVIGFLAEYDALPGVSQDAVPYRSPIETNPNGHACGHNLFGTASAAAAIAVAHWLQEHSLPGTVRVYGTPAEEGGSGKVYIARAGLVDDVDVMLHWHPASVNAVRAESSLANISAKFRFYGESSHASSSPHRGRSALDAVEAMNFMVNLLREHVPQETRMHYIITHGGDAPNVVPAFAESYHYVRHPDAETVRSIFERLIHAAQGAALGTGTRMEYEVIGGVHSVLVNRTLAEAMQKKLEQVGGVHYTPEEIAFAEDIIKTFPGTPGVSPRDAENVHPLGTGKKINMASTDVGDISWLVPTVGLRACTWVPGTSEHSWQATAAGGHSIGHKGMMIAAKVMALTAADLIQSPDLVEQARQEFEESRGPNFHYTPLVGEREPPLDYRKR